MSKKRALLVGTFLSSTRHIHSVGEDLAQRLKGAGWGVLTTSDRPSRTGRMADMLTTVWNRRNGYSVAQVDVYSGPAFVWAEAACFALRRAGKPYVLNLRGGNLPTFARQNPRRVRHLLGSAETVTAPSGYLRELMRPFRADLRMLPNPIDLTHYWFERRDRPQPRLVWLRAFHDVYNPALAVEVVHRLIPRYPDLKLQMVGPDKDGSLGRTEKAARRAGVAEHIVFRGGVPKEEVPACLREGDIFINTTNVDNTPVSVTEAMAAGLCIVSTDVGGIPYLLQDGRDALLVPPNDPDAFAAAVDRILRQSELAAQLSEHARLKVESFDWSKVFPVWEQLLLEAQTRRKAA